MSSGTGIRSSYVSLSVVWLPSFIHLHFHVVFIRNLVSGIIRRLPSGAEGTFFYRSVSIWRSNLESTVFTHRNLGDVGDLLTQHNDSRNAPRSYYDYHLTIPTIYLSYGKIVEIPWHVFAYMPKNCEILYGMALGIGNDSLTKLTHFIFGCLCLLCVSSWIKRIAGHEASMLAGLLVVTLTDFWFFSHPILYRFRKGVLGISRFIHALSGMGRNAKQDKILFDRFIRSFRGNGVGL